MIRVVAPYRPFPTNASMPHAHVLDGGFDWIEAIRMLTASVERSCGVSVDVLTDVDTSLPLPSVLQFTTRHRRLMLWYLEIAACYLESPSFDRDTVALDSDQLVFGNLARWFAPYMDLGILVRPYPKGVPSFAILNGVQFWAVRAKPRLIAFYRRALEVAEQLPERDLEWGADTIALERLLSPLSVDDAEIGKDDRIVNRAGVAARLIPDGDILERLSSVQVRQVLLRKRLVRSRDVLDFRSTRKRFMTSAYDVAFGEATVLR